MRHKKANSSNPSKREPSRLGKMVEDLGRHEWIKKYLRRKAGTHGVDLE